MIRSLFTNKSLVLITLFLSMSVSAQNRQTSSNNNAPMIFKVFPERQAERQQSRWTLSTWMETKKQIAEQNKWLWAHTNKVPMELALGYIQSPSRWQVEADIYLARIGLHLEYGKRSNWFADEGLHAGPQDKTSEIAAQLRLFGGNLQDTYLIGRIGYEYADFFNPSPLDGSFATWYAEPELQIYFAKWLGVRGNLKYRWAGSHVSRKTQKWRGSNYESVGFIEMGAWRIEGGYRWQNWQIDNHSDLKSEEVIAALKLFF